MTTIHLWHPARAEIDRIGRSQRCFNVLGRVRPAPRGTTLIARLGALPPRELKLGPDGARLAAPGDFNLDIDLSTLPAGETSVILEARTPDGELATATLGLVSRRDSPEWPLPWNADFTKTTEPLERIVQVIDGRWHLVPDGLAVVEPYYDRVIAFGDPRWSDYEVTARLRLRAQRVPEPDREVGADVIHVALTLRWPGHHADHHQPHRLWYPLGATCEFRFLDGPERCRWRILDPRERVADPARDLKLSWDRPFCLRARVLTTGPDASLYQCKAWSAETPEPDTWDLEHLKYPETMRTGCALLVAHFTAVVVETLAVSPLT